MKKLYNKLPIFFQHILLTVKNNQTYFLKYGAIPFLHPLRKVVGRIKSEATVIVNDDQIIHRIQQLVKEAIDHTTYYNEHQTEYLNNINSLELFHLVPILKKQTLREQINTFISDRSKKSNSYAFKTSGTTGAPLKGVISKKAIRFRFTVFLRALIHFGIDYSRPVARFSGTEIGDEKIIYRRDFINKHLFISIYHISSKNIQKYADTLNRFKIEILEGYPSTLYSMAKLFDQHNLSCPTVRFVLTTAEKLLPHQKETLERVFNTTIFDYYGSSEGSSFIFTCKNGKYHNANLLSHLEIVNNDDHPVSAGEEGRMVVTSFSTNFTPLVRYDIEDRCILSHHQNCSCNLGGIVLDEIIGRNDDVFITPAGNSFSRFSLCLKYLPNYIIRSQLHLKQKSYQVKVLIEKPDHHVFNSKDFESFEAKFESMLGKGYNFDYQFIREFPLNANGKLKVVHINEN